MSDQHTILIVEDDPGFAGFLKRLLRRKDLRLIIAEGGEQAIECLQANAVDLVLQDIGLPDIDGYEVMDRIRQQYPSTIVIVMTGEITVESALKALRKGAYDYLRKPFEATQLLNTIDNALDRIRLESQHKKAEAKLRESEERYRQLFDSESDAVVVFDAETMKFEDINQAALHLFGYSKEDLSQGLNLIETVISESTDDILGNNRLENSNFLAIRKDGSRFPCTPVRTYGSRRAVPTGLPSAACSDADNRAVPSAAGPALRPCHGGESCAPRPCGGGPASS